MKQARNAATTCVRQPGDGEHSVQQAEGECKKLLGTRSCAHHPAAVLRVYLAELLAVEVDDRHTRRISRRIAEAKFPRHKRLTDFDPTTVPDLAPGTLAALGQPDWIEAGHPVVLLGDSGTGKTHLLIGMGIAAAEHDKRVRYTSTAALVNELIEAADHKALTRTLNRYARLDFLCLDELNYLHLDPRGAELLFQIITAREERASIATASNAPFSDGATSDRQPGATSHRHSHRISMPGRRCRSARSRSW